MELSEASTHSIATGEQRGLVAVGRGEADAEAVEGNRRGSARGTADEHAAAGAGAAAATTRATDADEAHAARRSSEQRRARRKGSKKKSRPRKQNKSLVAASFVFAVGWMFFVGLCLVVAAALSLLVLFAFEDYRAVATSGGAQTFFLLGGAWGIFALGWIVQYAPNHQMIRWMLLLFAMGGCETAAYLYLTFQSIPAVVLLALMNAATASLLRRTNTIYLTTSVLPIEELTVQAWLTSFRLFAVVAAPLVASFIRSNGTTTVYPFFSLWSFSLFAGYMCTSLRAAFALSSNSNSTAAMLLQLTTLQVFRLFGPVLTIMFVFLAFYLIVIAGADALAPPAVLIALLSIQAVATVWFSLMAFAVNSNYDMLSFVNPFPTAEDQEALRVARERGLRERQRLATLVTDTSLVV